MRKQFRLFALGLTLATLSLHIGCSNDSGDDNGSMGGHAGEQTGGRENAGSGGSTGGANPGAGGAGGDEAGPSEKDCSKTTPLTSGSNYADYSLFAIRLDTDILEGEYSVRANRQGTAYLYRDNVLIDEFNFDPSLSLEENTQQTISVADLFEIDIRSQTATDLSGLESSIFDGCHVLSVTSEEQLMAGSSYGPFVLLEIEVAEAAPAGTYTFFAASGNSGSVELRRDGIAVDTLAYPWQTMIDGETSFSFEFPGVVTLRVTRAMGSSNLFALADNLFDGRQALIVTD